MLKKIIYLTIGALVLYPRNGFCDPVSAGVALFEGLSTIGAALGPAGVLAAGGLALEGVSALNQPKPPSANQPNTPAAVVPDPNSAAQAANDQMVSSRRALLLSGGETNLTGAGGAPLLGVKEKTLLGGGS